MPENVRAGRALARFLPLILGVLLLAALGAGAVAMQAWAQGDRPEGLSEAELLSRITEAPENAPDYRATATVEQTLVPEGLLGASKGDDSLDSGPRTVRIWHGGPEKFRAELQGEHGDRVFVRNGSEVSVYNGRTNTLRTGEKPEEPSDATEKATSSPEKIDRLLARISSTSDLTTGDPVQVAGRWAYPLTLAPKDKSLTLVEQAEAFVDAETFVPLSFELYAEGSPEPVVRYEARDFEVGPVPDERFEFEAPPGAEVVPIEPRDGGDHTGTHEVQRVASVAEAQELVDFPVKQLAEAPSGRKLTEVRVAGSERVVLTYGSGWGSVVLAQGAEQAGEPHDEELQIPTVDLGGGVEAKEISTPIGTSLSWSVDGVSYSLAGSVPAAELEEAARGLLSR